MNRLAIQAAIARNRFTASTDNSANTLEWISAAEVAIWNAADWEFKRVPLTNLTVVAGVATEPADFGKAIELYDPQGTPIAGLPPDKFEELYTAPVPAPVGNAEAYTVIDRQIIVGPTNSGTYRLSYRRRVSHRADGAAVTAGVMNSDLDTPVWDAEHHYILVPWAIRLGETMQHDPGAGQLDAVVDELKQGWLFRAMVEEHVGGIVDPFAVWGAS